MRPTRSLCLLPLAALACSQAPVRRLPVVEEMPLAPARASASAPAGDLVAFYPRAPSTLAGRPDLARYRVECSEPVRGQYLTLAMQDDGKSALVVLTAGRPADLSTAIASAVGERGSMDWGFAFDRNGDGWVDYLAYLEGTHPVETPEIAARVPRRPMPEEVVRLGGDPTRWVTPDEHRLMHEHQRLVFIHLADDDYDGRVDGLVVALHDPDRWGWIHRRAVVRSRAHSQVADEDWTFVQDIGVREGPVPREADGRMVPLLGLRARENHLERTGGLLDVVNGGLRACRLPRGALPRE